MLRKKVVNIILIMSTILALFLQGCSFDASESKTSQAYALISALDYEGALALFEEAETEDEDIRMINRGRGIAYIGKGEYQSAIESLEKALSQSNGIINGMDYDMNYYLATAYYKSGNMDEALDIYNTILSLKGDEVDAIYLRGVIYARKNMLDEAMTSFDEVIRLEPDNYDRIINIYTILADNGYKDVGQGYLNNVMETGTKKMSNYEKGQISFYLGDYDSAKTYLEKAKDEEGYEAVLLLGKTYETLGDNNYAVSVYSSYINAGEASPEIYNEMGLCKLAMNDYQGALEAFDEAMNISQNNMLQTLKFNEIVCYEYLGDFEKARILVENYLRSYPDDEKAKREYTFLKTR